MSQDSPQVIHVGICSMAKKTKSKPMTEILTRLQDLFDRIEIVIFEESTILHKPIENWPLCDCLISFYSKGFPLRKAIAYAELRKPYVINDLDRQFDLMDRTKVYEQLKRSGIEVPRYSVCNHSSELVQGQSRPPDVHPNDWKEDDDHITIRGLTFNKPFVEKPVSAEDHNIYIYYPSSAGGGSQRLFRKVNNRSSIYCPESRVRTDGRYLYEDFMQTDGTDVKVYAVGPYYAHAEARKSPSLDGKVDRDLDGKEIRYPVILSNKEKMIARKVVCAFKQTVCGFDLLRTDDRSYVCDVNGFSFVKSSVKYYEDSAKILGHMIMRRLAPTLNIPWQIPSWLEDPPLVSTTYGKMMELRCVLAVIRHGDRTPKQKMKMEVRSKLWFDLFRRHNGYKTGELKLKRPQQLQECLDIARSLLLEPDSPDNPHAKLNQLKQVLEMYGFFSGINRKVQLKYQPKGRPRKSSEPESGRETSREPSILLILKWGGELTPAGRTQAEELGKAFRCLYPGGQGEYGFDSRGLGFLRLHSTYRHDLKIYASDEGRVQMTAAAFAKGLLALDGDLTPILVHMVKSADTNGLLDDDHDARKAQHGVKKFIHNYFQVDRTIDQEDRERLNPTRERSVAEALSFIENPSHINERIYNLMQMLLDQIHVQANDPNSKAKVLYLNERIELAEKRWSKLLKDFKRTVGSVTYDISKIPDIYDCAKYDLQHNPKALKFDQLEELYVCSKYVADIVVPQEYGCSKTEKLMIGQGICTPLMRKLRADLQACVEGLAEEESMTRLDPRASQGIATPLRHVRTRLYFTSESHIHSIMNLLRFGGLGPAKNDFQWECAMHFLSSITEFNFLSQMVIMLYEDTTKETASDQRFHIELHFSPGALPCIQTTHVPGLGYRPKSRESEIRPNTRELILKLQNLRIREPRRTSVSEGRPNDKDHPPVSVVAMGNNDGPITTEELARHSPKGQSPSRDLSPSQLRSYSVPPGSAVMKSNSDTVCAWMANDSVGKEDTFEPVEALGSPPEEQETNSYNRKLVPYTEASSSKLRYNQTGFRRHTADILKQARTDQLISTEVICGRRPEEKTFVEDPLLISTLIINRGNSAPDLKAAEQGMTSNDLQSQPDVSDITCFIPPIRSLETLHNQLSLKQVDEFLERMIFQRTPLPSPPKTPHVSRENSLHTMRPDAAQVPSSSGESMAAKYEQIHPAWQPLRLWPKPRFPKWRRQSSERSKNSEEGELPLPCASQSNPLPPTKKQKQKQDKSKLKFKSKSATASSKPNTASISAPTPPAKDADDGGQAAMPKTIRKKTLKEKATEFLGRVEKVEMTSKQQPTRSSEESLEKRLR